MTRDDFLRRIRDSRFIASVQASPNSPVEDPETLLHLAQASLSQGAKMLRLQGIANITHIRKRTKTPVIGLIKRDYEGFEPYITPTSEEVAALIKSGCEVIALDGTARTRPNRESLKSLIEQIHHAGRLAMADCDSAASIVYSLEAGADIISTTLSGYTPDSLPTGHPDLSLVRAAVELASPIVVAEGRYQEEWQIQAALRSGAHAVVLGGALNDPVKQTRRFLAAAHRGDGYTAAIDLGGTWLRWGLFDSDWSLIDSERVELPRAYGQRTAWLKAKFAAHRPKRAGISAGGVIGPRGVVVEAKGFIPNYIGRPIAQWRGPLFALNDGLATAWGHACHPLFAGQRVATIAIGSGVGLGVADMHDVMTNARGDYPRLNDMLCSRGVSYETVLGGLQLGNNPDKETRAIATAIGIEAISVVQSLYMPDSIVLAGGVGLSDWFYEAVWTETAAHRSPFGADAGLYGAAATAMWPPRSVRERGG